MLKVAYIQSNLEWENASKNRAYFHSVISNLESDTDLVVLPEMFTTGFSMQPENLSESAEGPTLQWMKALAFNGGFTLTGSVIVNEAGHYYNRLYWVSPSGDVKQYDKRHLFTLAGEEKHYSAGQSQLLVELKGFKIMPLICYDLRFPVWSRNTMNYDVLIYVANWPEKRSFFWKQLLIARAIENQSYVIGVNRVGEDGNNIPHSGDSVVLDALGSEISKSTPNESQVNYAVLSKKHLAEVRDKFRFLNDQDTFNLT